MKLDYRRTFLTGLAFFGILLFWQFYEFHIPLILKNDFHIPDSIAGVVMAMDNILALFLLPFFGLLSDKCKHPLGRRLPFILLGTALSVACMQLLPLGISSHNELLFFIGLGAVLLTMSTYRSPAVALMPDITPKPLRSAGNAVINLMGSLGGALFLALNMFLSPEKTGSYWPLFIAVGFILVLTAVNMLVFVREKQWVQKMAEESRNFGLEEDLPGDVAPLPRPVLKSMLFMLFSIALWYMGYNAVTSAFSKYAEHSLHMPQAQTSLILLVAMVAALVAFIPVGMLSQRIGRKKSILGGVFVLVFVFAATTFYKAYSPFMYFTFALAGLAWATINVNSLPMVLEMSRGATVGQYTGYYYSFSMAAQVATPIVSGILLEKIGYFTLFPYAALFIALSFATMCFVNHGDSLLLKNNGAKE